jgi:transcriptional adapter 3
MDDFSKHKPPQQVLINTYYTSLEPWIRPIKEEDIGFLEYIGDEVEPFVMPKLGRHYTEVWDEEDMLIYGGPLPGFNAVRLGGATGAPSTSAPQPKWDPSTLGDDDLVGEERGHGPLTERAISALLPIPDVRWKGVKAAEDAMEGRPGGNGAAAAARKERMNVQDLETRIRDTMRAYGLLTGIVRLQSFRTRTLQNLTICNILSPTTLKRWTILLPLRCDKRNKNSG